MGIDSPIFYLLAGALIGGILATAIMLLIKANKIKDDNTDLSKDNVLIVLEKDHSIIEDASIHQPYNEPGKIIVRRGKIRRIKSLPKHSG